MHHPNENSHLNFVPEDIDQSVLSPLDRHALTKAAGNAPSVKVSLSKPKKTTPQLIELITEDNLKKLKGDDYLNKIHVGHTETPVQRITKRLTQNGGRHRKLHVLPTDYLSQLAKLAQIFPNFKNVIDYLHQEFVKFERYGYSKAAWQTPILLLGAPGVGKTHFATQMTEFLSLTFEKFDFSMPQANFSLVGLDRGYSEANEGHIFNLLVNSEYANPVLFIDEVDKCGDERHAPNKILLTLLEKEAANQFKDLFIKAPINAQHINWIFTANYEANIPKEILSRMMVFHIDAPIKEQAKIIAQSVFDKVCSQYEKYPKHSPEAIKLSDTVLEKLSRVSNPREMRKVLEGAIGKAAIADRVEIKPCDLNILKIEKSDKKYPIGFHPTIH